MWIHGAANLQELFSLLIVCFKSFLMLGFELGLHIIIIFMINFFFLN